MGIGWRPRAGIRSRNCIRRWCHSKRREDWPRRCQGLTLKNVTLQAWSGKKSVYKELGEMLCTHFGVSGPLVLTASRHLIGAEDPRLTIDLKPGLTPEQLEDRLLGDLAAGSVARLSTIMGAMLPKSLIPIVLELADAPPTPPATASPNPCAAGWARR